MNALLADFRDAGRSLRRNAGFSAVAILILALGIGSSTAVFTVVNSVLLQPLAFHEPERLVMIWERAPDGEPENPVSSANLFAWRERAESFTDLAAMTMNYPFNLTGAGEPTVVQTRLTSGNFFSVLGVKPLIGRTYVADEGDEDVAVLSWSLWQQSFGGDPNVVGRAIRINDEPVTVVGVLPADFRSIDAKPDLWMTIDLTPEGRGRFLRVLGRLAPGATLEEARAEMDAIAASIAEESPEFNANFGANVVALHDHVAGDIRPALFVLLGAVALLLLIACTNVANLFLGRAAARRKDFAIRLSLGGTRARLIRKTLAESLLLALIAGALGVLFAMWGTAALVRFLPPDLALPRLEEIGADGRVVGFAVAISLLAGALFGIAPALFGSAVALTESLREASRGTTGGRNRFRHALVVAEVAFALVLLVGAGLLGRSLMRLLEVDSGIRAERVLTARMTMSGPRYEEEAKLKSAVDVLVERLEALPGVRAVGGILWLPLTGAKSATMFLVEGRPRPREGEEPGADIRPIAGDYFSALGIPLLRGRSFDARDTADAPPVFVINQEMVRQQFPNEDPIGKRISYWWGDMVSGEIIGVVGTVRESGLDQEPAPAIYRPFAQMSTQAMTLVIRAETEEPAALASAVRAAVRELDPNQPLAEVRTMEEVVARTVARPRLTLTVLGSFAGAALLLAALGLYAIISYAVAQRTQEIGVRVALGAERRDVLRLVIGHGMRLTALGLLIGTGVALVAGRFMKSLLFDVGTADPLTLIGVSAFLAAIAFLASWIPARRATRVDPVVALRNE